MLDIGSPVGGKEERNFELAPMVKKVVIVLSLDELAVVSRLNCCVFGLCLDDPNELQTNEQRVISPSVVANLGVGWPLCNCLIEAFSRSSSLAVSQRFCVGIPSNLAQLFID